MVTQKEKSKPVTEASPKAEEKLPEMKQPKQLKTKEVNQILRQAKDTRAGWVPVRRKGKKLPRMWMPPGATHPIRFNQWCDVDQEHWTEKEKEKYEVFPPYKDLKPALARAAGM